MNKKNITPYFIVVFICLGLLVALLGGFCYLFWMPKIGETIFEWFMQYCMSLWALRIFVICIVIDLITGIYGVDRNENT